MRVIVVLGIIGAFWHFSKGGGLPQFSGFGSSRAKTEIRQLEQRIAAQEAMLAQYRYAVSSAQAIPVQTRVVERKQGGRCGSSCGTSTVVRTETTYSSGVSQCSYDQLRQMEQNLANDQYELRVLLAKAAR